MKQLPGLFRFIKSCALVTTILVVIGSGIGMVPLYDLGEFIAHVLLFFVITAAMSYGGFQIDCFYEKRVSWIKAPVYRFVITLATYLAYAFSVSLLIMVGFYAVWISLEIPWAIAAYNALVASGIALVVFGIYVSRWWLREWQKSAVEVEKLKNEKMIHQYKALVDQLNPHFLFNSLNTLASLVYEGPEPAERFIQKLSHIYRYVLDAQNRELVSLEEEFRFAKHYLSLQKIRYGERMTYRIPDAHDPPLYLPPLSLQMLLENALKHNKALEEAPLDLNMELKRNTLIVSNSYNPMDSQLPDQLSGAVDMSANEHVGLENIRKRYTLLGGKEPEIRIENNRFIVELPLFEDDVPGGETSI
ncbi:histidine kinase [Balneolaceae bacterium ANBcel3]|nr:histidine kinase [Balneolaceae bacterium ANBcel3]